MSEPVVIITGASRGIGRATAIELAGEGWRCALVARSEKDLREVANLAPNSLIVPTDVTDPAQIKSLVQTVLAKCHRIDAIVNNAGAATLENIEKVTPESWRTTIDTNVTGALFLAQAVWPIFKREKAGVIVNVSSPAAKDPFPGLGFYGMAKAAMNVLSLELARAGAEHNIHVHTIAPGATETDMFRSMFSEKQFSRTKTLEPADVARVIADCVTGKIRHASGEIIYLRR